MAKRELNYGCIDFLDNFVNKEIGHRMAQNGGIKVLKADIIADIAEYCGLSWESINRIKRGLALPSLPVALKIAQYFDCKVEDLFRLDEPVENTRYGK